MSILISLLTYELTSVGDAIVQWFLIHLGQICSSSTRVIVCKQNKTITKTVIG